ncbi:MAG: high-affinity branched-chain amino acid ABC transporter permease LivM [Rhodospirillales bacterium]|nr:high-affinity branched-chain amino acid ABC transporter permease LivM [Rhodospirillales bacterium]
MSNLLEDLKDSAAAAFFALLIFGPFIGLRLSDNDAGNLGIATRPEALALAVIAVFAARLLILTWGRHRPAKIATGLGAQVQKTGKFIAPALLVFAVVMPLLPGLPNAYIDLGVLIMTYVMLGWGLNIVVGLAGLLDLGYVAFYAVGAYSFALISTTFGLGFWECLPIAGILAAFWGMCLGFPVLRLRGDYLAIVTLAFGEIIRLVITNWVSLTGGPNGLLGMPEPTLFGLRFSMAGGPGTFAGFFGITPAPWQRDAFLYYVILGLALLTNWVTLRLRKQPLGRAWEALREDEIACRSLGINVRNTKLTAFAIGAFFGGFAGCFFSARQGFISPDSFTFIESATVLAIVVLGGAGSQLGVVLAACVMIGVPQMLQSLQIYRMLIFGIALVLIMIVRPRGFISTRRPTVLLGKKPVAIGAELRAEGRG